MRVRDSFSDAEWSALAQGERLAEDNRPFRIPARLTYMEQAAFREGYQTRKGELHNRSVVGEIKRMLGGMSFGQVIRTLVRL